MITDKSLLKLQIRLQSLCKIANAALNIFVINHFMEVFRPMLEVKGS